MTQNEAVVAVLRRNGEAGLTAGEALREIGTFRLAARINDIRNRDNGFLAPDEVVDSEMVRRGDAHVAKYVLRKSRVVQPVAFQQEEFRW